MVWLTRRGLAALGLPWKSVRPSYASVQTAAALVELRLAARERYPAAAWLSRRMLSTPRPAPSPLPDAVLTTGTARSRSWRNSAGSTGASSSAS